MFINKRYNISQMLNKEYLIIYIIYLLNQICITALQKSFKNMYFKLFFTFHHYDVISKFCFHWWICVNRRCQIRNWQCKGSILKGSYHGAPCHPTEITLQIINKIQSFRHTIIFPIYLLRYFLRYIDVTPDLALSSLYVAATSLNF